MATIGVN